MICLLDRTEQATRLESKLERQSWSKFERSLRSLEREADDRDRRNRTRDEFKPYMRRRTNDRYVPPFAIGGER